MLRSRRNGEKRHALDAEAAARTLRKGDEPRIEFLSAGLEPSLGVKPVWVGEKGRFEMDEEVAHADGSLHTHIRRKKEESATADETYASWNRMPAYSRALWRDYAHHWGNNSLAQAQRLFTDRPLEIDIN